MVTKNPAEAVGPKLQNYEIIGLDDPLKDTV